MQGPPGESYGLAAMDFDYVPATPGSRWVGESAARRRQRRLFAIAEDLPDAGL
ncbi:uncharacterized protein C2845_PM04G28660 [Panicum miliaceum]|uniref:Uncharacterized protein n=1 Tax=Panicum miliaceum TaxID=4540 RepID=A0A3L6QT93_PANMI|nr:uncharacterized protein C2845_PM04G28660 [Panicum miliaceum]